MNVNNLFVVIFTFLLVSEHSRIQAYRVFDVNGVETILALENENINIECKADMPMAYCGFVHPNGNRFNFLGDTLNAGHCFVNINATRVDIGEWRCHIGGEATGLEMMKKIQLRVVNHLAAIQQNISVVHRKAVTLSCATTEGLTTLSYCRFEPPNGQPFSINSKVRADNPILDRYYFPNNKSLYRGDCAVTIRKVQYEDVGVWTCGAGFDDGKEYVDLIRLDVEGLYTMSTASATGITFGVLGIVIGLAMLGFFAWKKRQFLGTGRDRAEAPEHELEELPQRSLPPSPQRTPQPERRVPLVMVQPPSEPSASPAQ